MLRIFGIAGGIIVVCVAVFVLYILGYIHWRPPNFAVLTSRNPQKLLAQADYLASLDNWQAARPYFAKAEHLFNERGDERNALYAKISCVEADVERGSYTKAALYLRDELRNPLVQSDARLKLRCLTVKGIVDLNVNTIDAERDWTEALNVANALHDTTWQNRATGWLGILDFVNGNGAGAGKKVIGALTECALHHDIGGEDVFLTYMSDGLTQDGMPSKGLAAANKALAIMRTNPDAPYPYRADLAKIAALTELKRYDEARSLIATALNHARKSGILGAEADLLREAGELEERAGNDSQSERYYRQTAAVASEANLPRIEGESMFRLTDLYRKQGNLPEAAKCVAQGIAAVRQVEAPYELPHYLAVEAELKEANGDYHDADSLFSEAADQVDGMLVNVPSPMLQSALVGTMSEIYVEHFQLAVRALKDDSEAFEIVERARGLGMADALRDPREVKAEAVSDSNPAEVQITKLQRQLRQQQTSAQRARLLDDLDEAETKLAGAEYERNQFRRLVPSKPVSLNALEHSLDSDEVVLEYVLSDPHSYCIVITRSGESVRTLASRTQIDKMIGQYLAAVTVKRPADAAAKRLYALLLGSCLKGENESRVIIVPDGKLNDIPFAALMDPAGRYVAEAHVVSVAPSATVLYMLRHEAHPEPKYAFLGVAYSKGAPAATPGEGVAGKLADAVRGVFDLSNPHIDPLPYANEEVKAAANDIGHGSVVLLGQNATEEKLKSEPLDAFEILHFAVHGVVNTHEPDRSALLFGDGPHSTEDGLWQAREIRTLSLKADLVTLSACDTGIGKIEGEEGVDSLVGAFLMAGAKNVVASLWPASDRYTATLMEKFYAHLSQGMDEAVALDRAEVDILQQYGHQTAPYYWAAFEIIGEGRGRIKFPDGTLNAALKN
ncbi:MAG TPA: CHAT domain-containing protein [Candidatus Angelobacter sp.]|nr:CHAT domain-containing protein [Candidatus Angelobacter sp.]